MANSKGPTEAELVKFGEQAKRLMLPRGTNDMAKFRLVVSTTYDVFIATGRVPSVDELAVKTTSQKATIVRILESEGYRAACQDRGIELNATNTLSSQQSLALAIVCDPTNRRALGAKLKQAGVTFTQWRAWQKQPHFKTALDRMADDVLNESTPEVLNQLSSKAVAGDLRAIQLHLEVTGRHDPRAKDVMNPEAFIAQVIEILSRRVTDQTTLGLVAGDFDYLLKNGKVGPMAIASEVISDGALGTAPVGNTNVAPSFDFEEIDLG